MDNRTKLTGLATLIAAVPSLIVAWQNYEHFQWGGTPEKVVYQLHVGPIDLLQDLAALASDSAELNINVGGQTYHSLAIHQFTLKNQGKTPVKPEDFVEALRVNAKAPLAIIAIREARPSEHSIPLEWTRRSAQQFEAKPFLLNPSERIDQIVYLTRTDGAGEGKWPRPPIYLTARIVNLTGFVPDPNDWTGSEPAALPLVYLTPGAVAFVVLFAALLMTWYAWSLWRLGYPRGKMILFIVLCSGLSYATAEVVAYYLFPGDLAYEVLQDLWGFRWQAQVLNWSVVLAQAGMTIYLMQQLKAARRTGS